MLVRPEVDADVVAIDAVLEAAFGQRDEADLVRALRTDDAWLPSLSLVALTDGVVVGHVALTRAMVDDAPVLALAPLAVLPDHQGRGIGAALVDEALRRAAAGDETLVVVLGSPAYYGRFGFQPARELGVTGPFGDLDAFQAMALSAPAPTGRMTYAEPFGVA